MCNANGRTRRVLIAYKSGLLGYGLQSLLAGEGSFDVLAVSAKAERLSSLLGEQIPQAVIVEQGALSPENAKAVLDAALAHPGMHVVGISLHVGHPTLWRALAVGAEGGDTVFDALQRHLGTPALQGNSGVQVPQKACGSMPVPSIARRSRGRNR